MPSLIEGYLSLHIKEKAKVSMREKSEFSFLNKGVLNYENL